MKKIVVHCQFCGEPGNSYSDGQKLCDDCYRIVKPKRFTRKRKGGKNGL